MATSLIHRTVNQVNRLTFMTPTPAGQLLLVNHQRVVRFPGRD